ncbi:hypothetical protein FACS1894185_7230 [Betaproteobacteria bacterium]|nr:hypothetical protein FACS1894185_7230 [Betaproteobacteria bacterium]
MSNDIHELHAVLFETLRGLKSGALDIDRVKAINDTAQTIINAAKVEVEHVKLAGGASRFISALPEPESALEEALPPGATRTGCGYKKTAILPSGQVVTQHKML